MVETGNIIKLGIQSTKEGFSEPIEWYVLNTNGNHALVIVKDLSTFLCPNSNEYYDTIKDDGRWKDSYTRHWLNHDVYDSIFSNEEKNCIEETIVNDYIQWELWSSPERCYFTLKRKELPTFTTRDKLFIPKLEDISEFVCTHKWPTYENEILVVKEKYNEIIKIWRQESNYQLTVLNTVNYGYEGFFDKTYQETHVRFYANYGRVNGQIDEGMPTSWSAGNFAFPVSMWLDISKFEKMQSM